MSNVKALSHTDERGAVVPIVALAMVALLIMTAIAVDGGNARQNRREAQAAADAGALAGAKSQDGNTTNPQPPACGTDINCVAAYYTFESAGIQTNPTTQLLGVNRDNSTCTARSVGGVTEVCYVYSAGGKTVTVTTPYSFNNSTPSTRWVHVRACWNSPNAFGKIAKISFFSTCGSATAENTGVGSPPGGPGNPPTGDCSGEDNFTDAGDNPTLYQSATPILHDTIIGATFNGGDSFLNLNTITFIAPTDTSGKLGQSVTLGYDASAKNGYYFTNPATNSNPKNATKVSQAVAATLHSVNILYQLPGDANLLHTSNGQEVVFDTSLKVYDTDQDHGANNPDCGNGSWKFTHDGKGLNNGSCGENSFFGGNPPYFPSNGTAHPGDPVYANYVDESPIQSHNSPYFGSPPGATDVGINFNISGPGFTHDDGNGNLVPYQIPPVATDPTGYTLTNSSPNYTTKIQWNLPPSTDARWLNGATYTIGLKAYDTDNNKPGNDCGVASWSFRLTGANNGKIHLIE